MAGLPTSYFKVRCWRRLAINTVSSLHKGDKVVIRGRFYMSNWVQSAAAEVDAGDRGGHSRA